MLLQDAQDVGDLLATIEAGAAPADHHTLADVGRCEPDLEPVAHACHLFPGRPASHSPMVTKGRLLGFYCVRGGLEHVSRCDLPESGKSCRHHRDPTSGGVNPFPAKVVDFAQGISARRLEAWSAWRLYASRSTGRACCIARPQPAAIAGQEGRDASHHPWQGARDGRRDIRLIRTKPQSVRLGCPLLPLDGRDAFRPKSAL
jgi:hypothetical protein